jgi:hypothetical protein
MPSPSIEITVALELEIGIDADNTENARMDKAVNTLSIQKCKQNINSQ